MIKAQITSVVLYDSRKVFINDCVNITIYNLSHLDCEVYYNNVVYPLKAKQSNGALNMPFMVDVSGHMFDAEIEIVMPKGASCVINQACLPKC